MNLQLSNMHLVGNERNLAIYCWKSKEWTANLPMHCWEESDLSNCQLYCWTIEKESLPRMQGKGSNAIYICIFLVRRSTDTNFHSDVRGRFPPEHWRQLELAGRTVSDQGIFHVLLSLLTYPFLSNSLSLSLSPSLSLSLSQWNLSYSVWYRMTNVLLITRNNYTGREQVKNNRRTCLPLPDLGLNF